MLGLFQHLKEYREWRKCRTAVKFATKEDADKIAMARLVGTPGFTALKALLIDAALTEMLRHGSKSEKAPGLATAVGLVAQCEVAMIEMTEKVKEQRGVD